MAEINRPELCIVGAGALGIALARHARGLGGRVVLVDRSAPEACDGPQRAIRLAALAASAAAVKTMRTGGAFGLATVDPKISIRAVQESASALSADSAVVSSAEQLAAAGIEIVSGEPRFVDPATLAIGEARIRPQAFILAVGGEPELPDIPGLEEAGYLTPDALIENTRKLSHLLVLGAGPDTLVLAQVYARLGAAVTLVPQGDTLSGFDIEASSILFQALADEGVTVLDGARVVSIQPRSQGIGAVVALASGEETALDLSHILLATRRQPDLAGLDLDAARLRMRRGQAGRYAMGAFGQTSNRLIRVVGIAAGQESWHTALQHGRSVVEALLIGLPRQRSTFLPQLVLTDPALAQVGRMPADASKLSKDGMLHRANLAENESLRARRQASGLIKVATDKRGRVTGASLVGADAAELASVLALAMDRGLALDDLADLALPNPSVMASLVTLGENQMAKRTVSSPIRSLGALRRRLRI